MSIPIPPASLDVSALPSLALVDVGRLPVLAALYFVLTLHEEIVYIGRAQSLRARWKVHHRVLEFAQLTNPRIAWLVLPDAALLRPMEKACIAYFNPSMNRLPGRQTDVPYVESMTVRFPKSLLDVLRNRATQNNRSLNAEIVQGLRKWIDDDTPDPPAGLVGAGVA